MSCCTSVEPIRFPIDMSKQSDILRVSSNLIRFEMKIKYKLIENIRITHRGHLQKPLIADSHTRGENALSRWKCVKRKISYFCVWKYTTKKNPLLKIVELSALRAYVFLSILRFSSSRFAFHSKFTSYFSFFPNESREEMALWVRETKKEWTYTPHTVTHKPLRLHVIRFLFGVFRWNATTTSEFWTTKRPNVESIRHRQGR